MEITKEMLQKAIDELNDLGFDPELVLYGKNEEEIQEQFVQAMELLTDEDVLTEDTQRIVDHYCLKNSTKSQENEAAKEDKTDIVVSDERVTKIIPFAESEGTEIESKNDVIDLSQLLLRIKRTYRKDKLIVLLNENEAFFKPFNIVPIKEGKLLKSHMMDAICSKTDSPMIMRPVIKDRKKGEKYTAIIDTLLDNPNLFPNEIHQMLEDQGVLVGISTVRTVNFTIKRIIIELVKRGWAQYPDRSKKPDDPNKTKKLAKSAKSKGKYIKNIKKQVK